MAGIDVDDDIAFSASAFNVVGAWLLGGNAAPSIAKEDEEENRALISRKAPVTLYRPSAKTASLAGGNGANSNGKILTEAEKEMKKKLLRKSGKYRHQQEEEEETVDNAALDREEEELVRYKQGHPSQASSKATTKPSTPATNTTEEPSRTEVVAALTPASLAPTKKRKVSAQEELLEKLREEAARKKAKNLKVKLRMQRKKEENKKLQTSTPTAPPPQP